MLSEKSKPKILIVDDMPDNLELIEAYLSVEPYDIITASSGKEAIELARRLQPDVVLMDLIMEDGTGVEASKQIKQDLPKVQIIILTSYIDESLVFPALEAGALSYLLKTSQAHEIVDAIRLAIKQEAVIEPKVATKMLGKIRHNNDQLPHEDLTTREMEVLILIGEGKTNQEIADELFIGIKTVKTHVSNVLSKLGVDDRTQAAIYAHRNKLV